MSRAVLAALSLSALAACSHGSSPSGPRETLVTATFGREFDLAVGAAAAVGEGGLRIAFTGVREDSRCPLDVVCVWEGDAGVALAVSVGRAAAETLTLHTTIEPRSAIHRGHTIHLVSLSPYPDSREPIDPDDYVARLRVDVGPDAPTD